jgi:hypothetical protein
VLELLHAPAGADEHRPGDDFTGWWQPHH